MVRDAKTGDDLTRSILLQIILEEEAGGAPMFTEQVLANIIRFYGHAMQGFMGPTSRRTCRRLTDMQAQLAEQSEGLTPEMWTQFMNDAVADAAGHDGQLRRAVQEHVRADAGADAEADRAGAGRFRPQTR